MRILPLALLFACTTKVEPNDSETAETGLGEDVDGDGYVALSDGGDDCDDADAAINPGAEETWYDGVDSDCSGGSDYDQDGDGADADPSGPDCDDDDATAYPGAPELCDTVDNDCNGGIDDNAVDAVMVYPDDDGDGYARDEAVGELSCESATGTTELGDCNDGEATVSPAAAETCNGVDDDCNTFVDDDPEDGLTYYPDFDGDSFGDDAASVRACTQPADYLDVGGDCDDSDALTYTGATELCDELDNDCDGTADEDATDPRAWYPDADGDGYGVEGTTVSQCSEPEGYASSSDDCDDADGAVNPGAAEICNDLDDDCDGEVDSDSPDAVTYHPDDDGDGFGDMNTASNACSAISGWTTDGSDCLDSDSTVNPTGTEICDGLDNDCDGTTDPNGASGSTTYYADSDGDGFGTPDSTLDACEQAAGWSENDDDCNDAAPSANPSQLEACDTLDNDCDGEVDEDEATDATVWHADDDGDTYGSETDTYSACSAPSGYVADGSDCDDATSSISPDGVEAQNTLDDDCDDLVDEDFVSAGDIVISEVARQVYTGGGGSSANANAQWFELYNASGTDVDLSGWYFEEQDGDSFYVSPDAALVVGAGQHAVLCYADTWFASASACDYEWGDSATGSPYYDVTFYFDRDEDLIALYLDGALMDSVHWYYDSTYGEWPRTARYSMSLDDDAADIALNDDLDNWCLSGTTIYTDASYTGYPDYGTPGSANASCD